ncbi:hypothetical protein P7K49_032672 [Saguinus oedipus]|uniref:Uncharacterized protein n=1 Tax=Saguinus oedipus TaxID=9490 RepID=A0ABQ9TPQ7_SAGOE|nr:hypothetical protein P7K49_032672 [Saguinus oedipus]
MQTPSSGLPPRLPMAPPDPGLLGPKPLGLLPDSAAHTQYPVLDPKPTQQLATALLPMATPQSRAPSSFHIHTDLLGDPRDASPSPKSQIFRRDHGETYLDACPGSHLVQHRLLTTGVHPPEPLTTPRHVQAHPRSKDMEL